MGERGEMLSFERIERIIASLREAGSSALTDLVLLLLPKNDEIRAVYLKDIPLDLPPSWRGMMLSQMSDQEILDHDGLIIAWSALDAIFPSLIPYGPNFYHIRWLFGRLQQASLGMETAYHLAIALRQQSRAAFTSRKRAWLDARIVQLSLPWIMKSQGKAREGLIGVIIPDIEDLLNPSASQRLQWLYYSPLQREGGARDRQNRRPPGGSWVVGMPEIQEFEFLPRIHPRHPRFLHLRPILQAAQWERALQKTVAKLSRYAWRRWKTTGDKAWRRRAYALAAEYRAYEEDATAVVAIRPHNDLKTYLITGQAWRYWRIPVIFTGNLARKEQAHPSRNTKELSQPPPIQHVSQLGREEASWSKFDNVALGIPLLRQDARIGEQDWIDLRKVLLRAGKKHELARLLWLFARELLPPLPSSDWKSLLAASLLDDAMDQLFIAYYFYNLLDPWRWRQGRHPFFMRHVHQTVIDGLQNIARVEETEKNITLAYSEGILAWYDNQPEALEAVPERLSTLIAHFQRYLDDTDEMAVAAPRENSILQKRREIARSFIELSRYLLDSSVTAQPHPAASLASPPYETPGLYRRLHGLLDRTVFFSHLSPFFQHALAHYHQLRQDWHNQKVGLAVGETPSRSGLRKLIARYQALQRTTFTLRHEKAILDWLIQRDITQIENLLSALKGGPIFVIHALNPWIIRDYDELLTVRIRNAGTNTAYDFHLVNVFVHGAAKLTSRIFPPSMDLTRGQAREWRWVVRAKSDILTMRLQYAYSDDRGVPQTGEETLSIPVRGRRSQLPLIVANPYRAGTPVSGSDIFVGREDILRSIFSRLLSGNTQPILLRGPRRIGKTSILHQIQWLMEDWERLEALGFQRGQLPFIQRQLVVMTSLQEVDQEQTNYTRFFFENILREIHQNAHIPEPFQPDRSGLLNYPAVAFRKLLSHWIETYIKAPVIILLDEWDDIYREAYRTLGRNLRAMIEHRQLAHVNWIISSTWVLAHETTQFGSPFYNQTFNLEVGALNWDAARRLVIEPSDRIGVDWQGEAIVAVLEQTGQRPYLLQLACSKVLDQLSANSKARRNALVTSDILHQALGDILRDAQSSDQYFGFLWEDDRMLSVGDDRVDAVGHLILWTLAEQYPQKLSQIEILDMIENAFRKQAGASVPQDYLLQRFERQLFLLHRIFDAVSEKGGYYTLSIPLIYAWLNERLQSYRHREELIRQLRNDLWEDFSQPSSG